MISCRFPTKDILCTNSLFPHKMQLSGTFLHKFPSKQVLPNTTLYTDFQIYHAISIQHDYRPRPK